MPNSFIENVNTVANSTSLATGDIVEDTKAARDEAVTAKDQALISETNASASELLASDWADKGHNNPVVGTVGVDAEYSSYHWSVESSLFVGDPLINDAISSSNYTWSSSKINTGLTGKADSGHNHNGVYEPVIAKETAFNKAFTSAIGDNGTSIDVARGNHTHSLTYEPKRATSGTAYNKDFGTTSGTVMQGDRNFDTSYMPLVTEGSAYNKSFVVNTATPLATEIPRGNHTHNATGVVYDNTGSNIITSSTAQGAIGELDTRLDSISVAEKCKLSAGMTNPSQVVAIATSGLATKLVTAMTVSSASKNALYSGGDITVDYSVAQSKLVEGWLSATVTISAAVNIEYGMAIFINDVIVDGTFRTQLGSATAGVAGSLPLSIDTFVSGLANLDKVSIALYNMTNTTDITITSHTITFAGEPEGALVISGSTVLHNDVTGRDAANQHPTTSIYDTGSSIALDVILDSKTDLVGTPVLDNMLSMDATGNIKDSGIASTTINNSMQKIAIPTLDNIVVMDSAGQSKDGGIAVAGLALSGGDLLNQFLVADATLINHAVSKQQMDGLASTYTLATTFSTHEGTANPHGTTAADVGAATAVHTHVVADTTGLQDELDGKYLKVATPVTDNITTFGAGGVLLDSGVGISDVAVATDAWATPADATRVARLLVEATDLDTVVDGGIYRVSAAVNKPTGSTDWIYLEVFRYATTYQVQTARNLNSTALSWERQNNNGVWSAWHEVFTSNNMGAGSGLDADTLQTFSPSVNESANSLVQRDASGYIHNSYFNTSAAASATVPSNVFVEIGTDGFIRKQSLAQFITNMGIDTGGGQVTAWVIFNGLTGAVIASNNIFSTGRTGTGQYTIVFNQTMTNTNYAIVGSASSLTSTGNNMVVNPLSDSGLTTSGFLIENRNTAGALQDRDRVSIIVTGGV